MQKLFLIIVVGVIGCQRPADDVQRDLLPTSQGSVNLVKTVNPQDGTYVFDVRRYQEEQLKASESPFKEMQPADVEKMLRVFGPFKIELDGDMAVASFSHDIIRGKLTKLSSSSTETRLHMTPVDQDKKDQAALLIINGKSLVLDPGTKDTDKMYFTRAE